MNFHWINLSNPVSLWWIFLVSASILNIVIWSWIRIYRYNHSPLKSFRFWIFKPENLIWFSALYVFGCAYRSFFIKADVQRICLFDTWFSSVFLGRTVATVAELAFVAQWSIVLKKLSEELELKELIPLTRWIVPLIIIAEVFSWYAVITTNYLGNAIEETLWTITYSLIIYILWKLKAHFKGAFLYAIKLAIFFDFLYILFMIFVDVKMYIYRFLEDERNQKIYLSFFDGIIDLNSRWIVTHDIEQWKTEIPWMTLYFSFAVLVSIGLCIVPNTKNLIKKYLTKE